MLQETRAGKTMPVLSMAQHFEASARIDSALLPPRVDGDQV